MLQMFKTNRCLNKYWVITGVLLVLINSCSKKDSENLTTVTDKDGNVYHTVTIGTQVWMAENLRVTKYRNGDSIPFVKDSLNWVSCVSGAYCTNNIGGQDSLAYGILYNWYAAIDPRNLAPAGWHVPTIEEWAVLIEYLGGEDVAGGKVKENGTIHWREPNTGATNETGFTALPGGSRSETGYFIPVGEEAVWWSTSEDSQFSQSAQGAYTLFFVPSLRKCFGYKTAGFSIRCIKD